MSQKFAKGDVVICIIADNEYRKGALREGTCYTISLCSWNLVSVEGLHYHFDHLRFRLATPLMKALV